MAVAVTAGHVENKIGIEVGKYRPKAIRSKP
jgi:hypothetical protein